MVDSRSFSFSLPLMLAIAAVMSPSRAYAQTRGSRAPAPVTDSSAIASEARASELKAKGDEALDQKRYEDALAAYDASYAVVPNPSVLYNRGRTLQFLARYPEALSAIELFATQAPPDLRARVPGLAKLLADLRARVGSLTVTCSDTGARIMLDRKQVATCPAPARLQVNAGSHVLEVFADGFFPFQRPIELGGGANVVVPVRLTSRDANGLLLIKSALPGVAVRLDGRDLGLAPAEAGVLAGTHHVEVSKDGYEDASTQTVLQRGERKELSLDPLEKPALTQRWWFWTGLGVIAAGAVTTVVLLSTEKPAGSGDFSPGRVNF